ncbi:MAG: hypothetical protein U5R48_04055 [Gammaproteobacteria bacterium]|nr:hypothetical protein [Gammaproteobacteria bacterium]
MAVSMRSLAAMITLLLVTATLMGCASTARGSLAEQDEELVRNLTIRCYLANREVLMRSSSPAPRIACREWAEGRARGL